MWFRILLGFPAVFLLSGFPLARLLLPGDREINLRLGLTAFATSLFLTYPAAVLTTMIEGQSATAIFSPHLLSSLLALFLVSLPFWLWSINLPKLSFSLPKPNILLIFLLLIYFFLTTFNLNKTNILGDDYDLAYQAYNLQDGILAARKAYIISFNTHPPLFMTVKHYAFMLFSPNGLDTLSPWMYRGMESLMGLATILTVYLLVREQFSQKVAILAAGILAVNNYMVFLGRVELREIYLLFFLTLTLYFFIRKQGYLAAFFFGVALLIKTSAIILLPLMLIRHRRALLISLAVYIPVLIYNLLAFITTGHLDATFSKIFGTHHPFLTGSASPFVNLQMIPKYLIDIYSLPIFVLFLVAFILANFRRQNIYFIAIIYSSLLYFVFSGPLREYYLIFITIPLAIITATNINQKVVGVLLLYSFWYCLSGQSTIRKIYEPFQGWSELVSQVTKIYHPDDCLLPGNGVNDLAMRAYFQTDDGVKQALLGPTYPHFFKTCSEVITPNQKIVIYYGNSDKVKYEIL